MGQLTDLEGTTHAIDCEFFNKSSDIREILSRGIAATTANTNGAINVWIDDAGLYRASLHRYLKTIDRFQGSDFKMLQTMVGRWLKQIK